MYVLSTCAMKGGVGRTFLALNYLVEAGRTSGLRVGLVDMDGLECGARWLERRANHSARMEIAYARATPTQLARALRDLRVRGLDLVIVDTSRMTESVSAAAGSADLVVIPISDSPLEVPRVEDTLCITDEAGARAVVVMNKMWTSTQRGHNEARYFLDSLGVPVCPTYIYDRVAHGRAVDSGLGTVEYEPGREAAKEISYSWLWIQNQLGRAYAQETGDTAVARRLSARSVPLAGYDPLPYHALCVEPDPAMHLRPTSAPAGGGSVVGKDGAGLSR